MLNSDPSGAVSRQIILLGDGSATTSAGFISLLADTGKPLMNNGQVFQAGCSVQSSFITSLPVTRKSATLCAITDWYMGVFLEPWASDQNPKIPYVNATDYSRTMSLVGPGRTVRVNHPNYVKYVAPDGIVTVSQGPEVPGEGLYACFNQGACVSPDLCQCTQGWGGYDCNVPQCAYTDVYLNAISGCSHGGICMDVNVCYCPVVPSLLYQSHPEMPQGANTGWMAKDCTMAMCVQGYLDPTCQNVPPGAGGVSSMGQGCYKCWNNGTCLAPDTCACPDSWQGYDCKTPVCVVHADRTTIANLVDLVDVSELTKAVDPLLVTAFEYDPCGMGVLVPDGLGNLVSRGNCTRPGVCTCFCRQRAYKDAKGAYSDSPWQDTLGRALAPGFIYGRFECVDGYEGNLNADGTFSTCHLAIYVPTFLVRNTVTILIAALSSAGAIILSGFLTRRQLRIRATQIKTDRRRTRRMEEAEAKEFERANAKKSKNKA